MGKPSKFSDIIDPEIKFSVTESQDVDGEHVLAKIKGQFFVPDGKSRNGRWYSRSLWEKVVTDPVVKQRLNSRTMFGTVGHDETLNDKAVREGLISHFMTNVYIDEKGKGMGEALILNTPTGRILNTVLRAGSQLFVSSRANGTFKGKKNGLPVVDEETYDLDGWDFVIDPGFLEANPNIAESLESNLEKMNKGEFEMDDNKTDNKDGIMNEQLIKVVTNENASLKNKVSELTDEVSGLKEENKTLAEENDHFKGENDKVEDANKKLEAYSKFGTPEEIQEKLDKAEEANKIAEAVNELTDNGVEAIKTALENAKNFHNEITEKFDGVDAIEEAFDTMEEFKKRVDAIGTIEHIEEAVETLNQITEEKETEIKESTVKELVEETGLSEEKVKSLLEKYSADDIKELYATVNESNDDDDSNRYRKSLDEKKKKKKDEEDDDDEDEDDEEESRSVTEMNRISRINSLFS